MEVGRWQRTEEIFHQVVDEPPGAAREARVTELAGGDAALVADVLALLEEDRRLTPGQQLPDPHVGLRLGSYEVDRLIARGGMAAVYLGHRADEQFRQTVAIKIMDLRVSDPALVEQFKAERQILAALEHPSITRLVDGGVTSLGEPYLVMEHVDGVPIDRYCDTHRLNVLDRIALFMQVCHGVAFAHRNLVLHRDLKPSNILVTADGHVKVVDFGTATLLQPDRLATVSRAPLTPAYASPEQLTGGAVGTASDQYSLALVLYELLTGVSAFAGTSLIASMERALAGAEPPATSHTTITPAAADARQTSPTRLRRQLAGDLGTIVRKALSADPAARYSSVEHLADDLMRWRAGEPILGRAPSVAYRASRFVRRHWAATAVAATLMLALAASTAVSLSQAARARAESAKAQIEAQKAQRLNSFFVRMLSAANPNDSEADAAATATITVREVLDRASERIGNELGGTPAVEAEMRMTIGNTYSGLGIFDKSIPHLERAIALFESLGETGQRAVAQGILGSALISMGERAAAEPILRDARAYAIRPDAQLDPVWEVAIPAHLAAVIGYRDPFNPEALELIKEAVANADKYQIRRGYAATLMHDLGLQYQRLGRLEEAEAAYHDALRRIEALGVETSSKSGYLQSLAMLKFQRGEWAEAARIGDEAFASASRTLPPDHFVFGGLKTILGRALVFAGEVERGRTILLEAYATRRKTRAANHPDMMAVLVGLGAAARLQGNLVESERLLREARAIGLSNPRMQTMGATVAGELGATLRAKGAIDDARPLLEESYKTFLAAWGPEHPVTQQALERMQGSR